MGEISVLEFKALQDSGKEYQLIDIRDEYELEICNIGGTHIPMNEIAFRADEVRKDIPVIIQCRSGKRSAAVISHMNSNFGYTNLLNLVGGILAYANEIDTSLEQY